VSQGCTQISMGSHKASDFSRKRQESTELGTNSCENLIGMAEGSPLLFRRYASRLMSARKKKAMDHIFDAVVPEANQELAQLLRDVRSECQSEPDGDRRSPAVNKLLMRAVRCAAKQYKLQAELGNLALTDELTGLYNRRGFMAVAERQLKLARRCGRGLLLFFIDLDGLKRINDSFGHSEGDRALKYTAEALENGFRDSDVIARLGGDEFAVLAIEASDFSESAIMARVGECLKSISGRESRYSISLSLGAARFDPRKSTPLRELMLQADHAMYEVKRGRLNLSGTAVTTHRTE
jgi:diguanylate cyclase (GGDEF)-like protein